MDAFIEWLEYYFYTQALERDYSNLDEIDEGLEKLIFVGIIPAVSFSLLVSKVVFYVP